MNYYLRKISILIIILVIFLDCINSVMAGEGKTEAVPVFPNTMKPEIQSPSIFKPRSTIIEIMDVEPPKPPVAPKHPPSLKCHLNKYKILCE